MPFRELQAGLPKWSIEGRGERIAQEFYIPVLRQSVAYDRQTGYFSVDSLVLAATGLAGLIRNGGRMRLLLGSHDVPEELYRAYQLGQRTGRELIEELGRRIAGGLESVEDLLTRRRLEALAWMLQQGILQVRVVLPKHFTPGQWGIFHHKSMVFRDASGDVIATEGSANETIHGYTVNGERIMLMYSWREGDKDRIEDAVRSFETIWEARHLDYETFELPEAVAKAVVRFAPSQAPERDPWEPEDERSSRMLRRLVPAARLVRLIGRVRGFAHLGLGPVRLYPHQVSAVNFAMTRFPRRLLFADEVGLGKTIEVGACIQLMVRSGLAKRVLVLAPKNVTPQWHTELCKRFGLPFRLLLPGQPPGLRAADDTVDVVRGNPFDAADFLVASWHYARGRRNSEPEVLRARPFDLVVIDEAHAARISRSMSRARPTRLHELAVALSTTSPHVFLMSATPVQLNILEAQDLLRILGLGGPWVHEEEFQGYYDALAKESGKRPREDWELLHRLASWFAVTYLDQEELERVAHKAAGDDAKAADRLVRFVRGQDTSGFIEWLGRSGDAHAVADRFVRSLAPFQWFMIRNRREPLKAMGYRFPERAISHRDVHLDAEAEQLLKDLTSYLEDEYDALRKVLGGDEHKGRFGLVKSVYYQRFVSSFAAAYRTVQSRREFLDALLSGDEVRLLETAERIVGQVEDALLDEDMDERDLVDMMRVLVERARPAVQKERDRIKGLEERLEPLSHPGVLGDRKIQTVREVVRQLRAEGRKVLVFSKFTDTVEVVRDTLAIDLGGSTVATYTGRGGEVWDESRRQWRLVDKEIVRRALEGDVSVLVCSEAASEGLNLQAAHAVVNVDMPWNPARLEQRIGRVDRIGQLEPTVRVVNVWYPDTYEAQMYRALFDRHEIWWVVVGPAASLIEDSLRRSFEDGVSGERLHQRVREAIERVEEAKGEAARLHQVLGGDVPLVPMPEERALVDILSRFVRAASTLMGIEVREEMDRLVVSQPGVLPPGVRESVEEGLWKEAGRGSALVPGHPFVQWLAVQVEHQGGPPQEAPYALYGVVGTDGQVDLFRIDPQVQRPEPLDRPSEVVQRLQALIEWAEVTR